ncbi:hypothetical protein M758_3G263800 [Ceratodon purpureus]|nr:hypothetical protein M758_3G263800 [Ceratodon purpureus]
MHRKNVVRERQTGMRGYLQGQLDYAWRDLVGWAPTFCRGPAGCGAPTRKRCESSVCMCLECWYGCLKSQEWVVPGAILGGSGSRSRNRAQSELIVMHEHGEARTAAKLLWVRMP